MRDRFSISEFINKYSEIVVLDSPLSESESTPLFTHFYMVLDSILKDDPLKSKSNNPIEVSKGFRMGGGSVIYLAYNWDVEAYCLMKIWNDGTKHTQKFPFYNDPDKGLILEAPADPDLMTRSLVICSANPANSPYLTTEIIKWVINNYTKFYPPVSKTSLKSVPVRQMTTSGALKSDLSISVEAFRNKYFGTGKTLYEVVEEMRSEGYTDKMIVSSVMSALRNVTWDK